jgi:hypothetical protein
MLAPGHDNRLAAQRQPRLHPRRHVPEDDLGQRLAEDGARLVLAGRLYRELKPQ